ncbi:MAG: methylmalonyl-CoA epimerase [Crenarchaeota archaeon]|nr:methylmalonyl-CoA epimerase [Thermoproteota archaeon]
MKVLGIHHVAIAVKDLDEALKRFSDVLGARAEVEEVPEEKVRVAMIDLGNARIELLQGLSPDSAISKFIEKRGEGIHHIAVEVDNIDEACREISQKGYRLVYPEPKLVAGGKRRVNFVHPKDMHGVLLELVEVVK